LEARSAAASTPALGELSGLEIHRIGRLKIPAWAV
jgi:hypothetical protein